MKSSAIVYQARTDATPESELPVLATIYRFVLDCHTKKEAAPESRPDDGTKIKEDSANEGIIPEE